MASLYLSSQYTRITNYWTQWKAFQSSKGLNTQYFDDGTVYTIYGYDGQDVHVCLIWKGTLPQDILDAGVYTQVQNDADKLDFTTNYQPTANARQALKANTSIVNGGINGAITVGTSAVEAKVGGSRLSKRTSLSITNNGTAIIYFGFSSGVTTANGTPIYVGQVVTFEIGDEQGVFLISGTAGNDVRITETT